MPALPPSYAPTLPPFDHQREALEASYMKRNFALFMEQGLGKTKVVIDNACLLFLAGHITGLLVVSMNDVHAQWIDEQLPEHCFANVKTRSAIWDGSSARAKRECTELIRKLPHRLHVVAMNIEACRTPAGKKFARDFMKAHATMLCVDESQTIAVPKATQTRAMWYLGPFAYARRIATGTPIANWPFDLYAQFRFLHKDIIGQDSFVNFKSKYGKWKKEVRHVHTKQGVKNQEYLELEEYQNIDELYERIDKFTFRAEKSRLKLPPKMTTVTRTHLSKAQRELYDTFCDSAFLVLDDPKRGKTLKLQSLEDKDDFALLDAIADPEGRLSYQIKMTLTLRCHQIVGGFATDDAGRVFCTESDFTKVPRYISLQKRVEEALANNATKIIVWSMYRAELAALTTALNKLAPTVEISGAVPQSARRERIANFKDRRHRLRIVVGHPRCIGVGQNFTMAENAFYYSTSYSYIQRVQSEDRIHRIGTTGTVTLHDFNAQTPVEAAIFEAQRTKTDFAKTLYRYDARAMRALLKGAT